MSRGIDHPYRIDGSGRTATAEGDGHVRDLIEQVLFTAPGERVMRPGFGSGLLGLTFEPGGPELEGTVQFLVQGALGQWLGDLLAVESVEVRHDEGTLSVTVDYRLLRTSERGTATVERSP